MLSPTNLYASRMHFIELFELTATNVTGPLFSELGLLKKLSTYLFMSRCFVLYYRPHTRIHCFLAQLHLMRNRLTSSIPTEVGQMGKSLGECNACVTVCDVTLFSHAECTARKPCSLQRIIGHDSVRGWCVDKLG